MATDVLLSLKNFTPELSLLAGLVVLFLVDAFIPRSRGTWAAPAITIIFCGIGTFFTCGLSGQSTLIFSNLAVSDGFSNFFRYFFFFACSMSAIVAAGSNEIGEKGKSEFFLLLLCTTFGLSLMAISKHLLTLYLAIETVSIVSFVMAGFTRSDMKSNEASFKYLVFGALASGLMIYGFSLIYGMTGSLQYAEIGKYFQTNGVGQNPLLFALSFLMIYGGLAYKISSFPFHFWTPDVYEGSPTPVATFFSVGPKAAGIAAFIRIFLELFAVRSGEGAGLHWKAIEGIPLVEFFAFISAATMCVGNLSAIAQTSTKRIFAYSSIAHIGYLIMGFVTLDGAGMTAILFYLIVYCLMNIGAFWVVGVVHDLKGSDDIEAFRGLGWSMPLLGVCMAIFIFSLTGIPLFSGFIGKFLLFGAVIKTKGFLWLAVLGVLNSVVSLYYYTKILKAMWFDEPTGSTVYVLPLYHAIGLVLLAVPTIVFGLFFSPLIQWAERALVQLM